MFQVGQTLFSSGYALEPLESGVFLFFTQVSFLDSLIEVLNGLIVGRLVYGEWYAVLATERERVLDGVVPAWFGAVDDL